MANYKFSNFIAELVDPTIHSVSASFMVGGDMVNVTAVLSVDGGKLCGVQMGQMPNTESWGDEDVQAFAIKQLETFKVDND